MTSVSPALPGFSSSQTQPRQQAAAGKDKDRDFGEMVHGNDKPDHGHDRHASTSALADPHQVKRASANAGKQESDQDAQGKSPSHKTGAGKSGKGNSQTEQAKATTGIEAAAQADNAAPLQDRLPLLMALGDMKHFAATSGAGGNDSAGGEEIAGNGQPAAALDLRLRQGKDTAFDDPAEPSAQSARAGATDEAGPDFGQKPVKATANLELPGHPASDTSPAQADPAQGDGALPQSWRPGAAKAALQSQSGTSQGQARSSASGARTEVVSQQSFPAPAQNPMSQTTSALVDAIASDKTVQQSFSSTAAGQQTNNSVAVPTHVLKIELHPAELGAVTASLRLQGEQLSIEMKPETHEAYRRLTTDSDAIVKSMRSLGFDVDHVTILQPAIAAHAASRADANGAMPMSTASDQPSFQPGNSGGNSAGGGRQSGRDEGNGAQDFGNAASPHRERAGDDMFI
ncbi:flagellar hook-length control protein FliK [Mesorhizobium sp. CU2]|uniref:flagellar hook-length control protein FliK n=1 Tax=unclassified Mesorhizobium TaxID=325217 RepID=UPI00112D601E|nr:MULTISPECIES: flagellar hook-length control protein FliK [unclassified Mesorhizobium]TPN82662.1 flagellar hook-length control protein FliK [Mesorhizobium sp. CU3]TPO14912.1 flagellar hook-length control protein FliK [Mesorhizobium sp. CU2]